MCIHRKNRLEMSSDSMNEKESGDGSKTVNACSMHPDSALFKTVGLIFICSIGFGSYFCYDIPGALEVLLVILSK